MKPKPIYKDIADILYWNSVKTYRQTKGGMIAIHKRRIGQWLYFAYTDTGRGGYYYFGDQEHFTHEDGTTEKI